MKKNKTLKAKWLLVVLLAQFCCLAAVAGDYTVTVTTEDNFVTCSVTAYTPSTYTGKVVIDSYRTYKSNGKTLPIVGIESSVFKDCALTGLVLSENLTYINSKAFWGCSNLSTVSFPSTLETIGQEAFYDCGLKSVRLPNNLKTLGAYAFQANGALKKIVIPSKLANIPATAFYKCGAVEDVTFLGNDLSAVVEQASFLTYVNSTPTLYVNADLVEGLKAQQGFSEYEILPILTLSETAVSVVKDHTYQLSATVAPANAEERDVTWSSSDESIATVDSTGRVTALKAGTATIVAAAYNGDVKVECQVTVPPTVTGISFDEAEVDIPRTLTYQLRPQVFPAGAGISSFDWSSSDESIATVSETGVVKALKEGSATIKATANDGSGVEGSCRVNVKSVTIELSAKTINLKATETYNEQEITLLPESYGITKFAWKTSDPSVATVSTDGTITGVSPGIATITYSLDFESDVTAECKVIVYDQSVVYVGGLYYILDASSKQATVTGIYGAGGNGFDEEQVAQYYSGTVNIPSTVTYNGTTYDVTRVGGYAFVCQNDLQSIYIPSSVVTVEPFAATNAKNLQLVNVEDGSQLQNIGIHAFRECTGLRFFTFDGTTDRMKSIDAYAFYGDTRLERIKWSGASTINTIGDYAFYKCTALNNFLMPNSVTSVGNYSFRYDEALTDITLSSSLNIINEYAFGECGFSAITLPESLASMQAGAFINNKYLSEITIPAKVQGIGAATFENNAALQTVTFKTSIGTMTIGDNAFNQCPMLSKVNIDHLDSWAQTNFSNAKANPANTAHHIYMNDVEIINVKLPDGTKYINNNAFNGCTAIVSLTVPETVDRISDDIIYGCTSLTDVYCYAEEVPTFIGTLDPSGMSDVFRQATLHVLHGTESAYRADTWWGRFYSIAGCDKPEPEPEKVTSITLSQSEATLRPDDTLQLTATVYPTDAADRSVTWESSDESVAMVTDDGFVLALSEGTADITVTARDSSGVSAVCRITVEADRAPEVLITSLTLEKTLTLPLGESMQLMPDIQPDNATNKTLTWKSANPSVVDVDEAGNILGVSPGKSIITAKTTDGSNLTANCVVTVATTTRIDATTTDTTNNATYYTLSGVMLHAKPQQEGVYIRVKDGKSQKVIVRRK